MSYARKAVRGIGIIFLMNIFAYFIAYLTRLILARKLGPADYGLFYAVFTFVIFFLFFRDLGLNPALTKYISEFKIKNKFSEIKTAVFSVLLSQITSSIIFAVLFFILAPFLAAYYFKNPAAELILKIMIGYTIFSISFTFLKAFFSGFQKFRIYAFIDTAKNSIVLILILIFFSINLKILSPVLAFLLVGPILILIFLPFIIKTFNIFKYKTKNFSSITKMLFAFGLPVIMTDIGDKVISYIDTLMLTSFRTLEEVGIYNVALPTAMAFLFLGTSVSSVVFPLFAELWAKKDKKRLSLGLNMLHKYTFALTAPIIFTVFAFSDLLIKLFFSEDYMAAALPLQILLVGVFLFIVAMINHSIISAIGRPKTVTKIIFLAAVTNAILNLILIPKFGISGAASATTISYALALILSTYKVNSFIKAKLQASTWIKTIIAAVLFVSIIFGLKTLLQLNPVAELILTTLIALIIYTAALFILKLINLNEIKHYISLILAKKDVTIKNSD